MGDKVRVRSSDGLLFEISLKVARLSPIIADVLDLDDGDEEVPLPMVRASVLSQILAICEGYIDQGHWDTPALRRIRKHYEQLEQLTWAANYLCLEELMILCLSNLASAVKENGPDQTCVSVVAMRRALRSCSECLATETVIAVLEALSLHASRGDLDSVTAIHLYLDSDSAMLRKAAIAALGRLAPLKDVAAIALLRKHVEDRHTEVQLAALRAIAQVVARGNEPVIIIVKQKSLDGDAATRCAALEAVGRIAVRGAAHTIAIARRGLADSNGHVRKVAVEAFAQLVQQGDKHAALELIKCLEDMDESVRQAAIQALPTIIGKDNDAAIKALSERLEHRYWWVCWAAAKVLGECAPQDEPSIVDAIVSRLGHENPSTRQVAWQALAQVASQGNVHVIKGLKVHLQHHDLGVRQIAVKAMAKFGRGEEAAIKVTSALLEHPKHRVRKSALEALKLVATQGSERAGEEVSKRITHPNAEVRLAALLAILEICNRNDHCAIEAICRGLLDRDGQVQDAAISAFGKIVEKGHPHAIFNFLGLLDTCDDGHALRTTICMLPLVAGCSERSLSLVSTLLEQQSMLVRSSVFDVFMQMSDKRYRPCVLAKCSCWNRDSPNSELDGGELEKATELELASVRIATQALSSCLLQPGVCFPDAVAAALQKAGVLGSRVAMDLSTCMSSKKWFMRWQTIELLCRNALAPKNGVTACSTTSAKVDRSKVSRRTQRKLEKIGRSSHKENMDPSTHREDKAKIAPKQCSLHRPGCPFNIDTKHTSKRSRKTAPPMELSKRARFGGA